MWSTIQLLPVDLIGAHTIPLLETRDYVRLETAIAASSDRARLSALIRAGGPVDLQEDVKSRSDVWKWHFDRSISIREVIYNLESCDQSITDANILCAAIDMVIVGIHVSQHLHVQPKDFQGLSILAANAQVVSKITSLYFIQVWQCAYMTELCKVLTGLRTLFWSEYADAPALGQLMVQNPRLEEITFVQGQRLTESSFFRALVMRGSTLRQLKILTVTIASDQVRNIAHCAVLKSLWIETSDRPSVFITAADLAVVASGCSELERVTIRNCCKENALIGFAKHCSNLRTFDGGDSGALLTESVLADLRANCPYLSELKTIEIASTASEVHDHAVVFQRLQVCEMSHVWVGDEVVSAALGHMTNIRELRTLGQIIGLKAGAALARASTQLRKLQCICSWPEEEGIQHAIVDIVRSNRFLQVLSVHNASIVEDAVLYALAEHCPALRELDAWATQTGVTDQAIIALASNCRHLSSIGILSGVGMSGRAFEALAEHCQKLRYLSIGRCPNVSNADIVRLLQRCGKLDTVEFLLGRDLLQLNGLLAAAELSAMVDNLTEETAAVVRIVQPDPQR